MVSDQGAPASTGFALCSVLANLAMNENFRESFAKPYLSKSMGGGVDGGGVSTVAAVLVLVARDMKVTWCGCCRTCRATPLWAAQDTPGSV